MKNIESYKDLIEKENFFNNNKNNPFIINSISEFDSWYTSLINKPINGSNHIYRGISQANYKQYNSAQRYWILNALNDWKGKTELSYLEMIRFMLQRGKDDKLFRRVFEFYNFKEWQTDFPLMSILQHYGAPTPLLDWTYSLDIALYFATENLIYRGGDTNISDYFSIYCIDKTDNKKFTFKNLKGAKKNDIPKLEDFVHGDKEKNVIYYLSDFEDEKIKTKNNKLGQFTSIYNQNIIPQEGLLFFNPFPITPFEECMITEPKNKKYKPIVCVNIHKHIVEYIRRRLKKRGITKDYIYPQLNINASGSFNKYLDDIAKEF